jgi:hypothetical protein
MSFTTGDVDIKIKDVKITNEKDVTLDYIVQEANSIYREMKKANYQITDFEASDKFTARMRKEHPEFAQSYPIVLRYICQMGEYKTSAFKKYLEHIAKNPWKSKAEYLESQCDYVVMLYKATKSRWSVKDVANLRKNVHAMLKKEDEVFVKVAEKTQKEVESEEEQYKQNKRSELQKFYGKWGYDTGDMQIRTETDITTDNTPEVPQFEMPEKSSADDLLM